MDTIVDPDQPLSEMEELATMENSEKIKQEEEVKLNAMESGSNEDKFPSTMCAVDEKNTILTKPEEDKVIFKKPVIAIGSMRRKVTDKPQGNLNDKNSNSSKPDSLKSGTSSHGVTPSKDLESNLQAPIPYTEPSWAGYPSRVYSFEIIKGGQIIENFDLSTRSCHSIGRSPINDVVLLHPTMSRFHAVIQFRDDDKGTPENPPGMYIYDMGSTHGTFLNKNRIKSRMYVRVHVGHILKFGASTRHFLLKGPLEDEEEESLLSVTQILNQRNNELIRRKLEEIKGKVPEEDQGISWGMDDDADEETDLSINPFALTNNEELYIDDPKKTLRGWFEREGHELLYNVEEKSPGHFRCFVDVPVETCPGGTHVAEATVHGKKKEAVLQCALEACRVLDRYGLLRQATHESKKRKAKDWEADDYYDSDDDMFLDRTGIIEKKRQARIAASKEKPESLSYAELVTRHQEILRDLADAEETLSGLKSAKSSATQASDSLQSDPLDAYMDSLQSGKEQSDGVSVSRLKMKIKTLTAESVMYVRLLDKASPSVDFNKTSSSQKSTERGRKTLLRGGLFGMRLKRSASDRITCPAEKEIPVSAVQEEVKSEGSEEPSSSGYGTLSEMGQENVSEDFAMRIDQLSATAERIADGSAEMPDSVDGQKTKRDETRNEEQDEGMGTDEENHRGVEKGEVKKKKRTRTRNKLKNFKSQKDEHPHELFTDWTPPQGQSGDGRTSLNEKLGY